MASLLTVAGQTFKSASDTLDVLFVYLFYTQYLKETIIVFLVPVFRIL